jgi:hypothetical protein
LLKTFITLTYHASLRPLAHREKGYSAECVERLSEKGVLGSDSLL